MREDEEAIAYIRNPRRRETGREGRLDVRLNIRGYRVELSNAFSVSAYRALYYELNVISRE